MKYKKYIVSNGKEAFRIYRDGLTIKIDSYNNFQWRLKYFISSKSGSLTIKGFTFYSDVDSYYTEYNDNHGQYIVKLLESYINQKLPEDINNYLLSFDLINKLSEGNRW